MGSQRLQRLLDIGLLGQPVPFFLAVGLTLLARGLAVADPLYSLDAYLATRSSDFSPDFMISQGRWGLAMVAGLRDLLGYGGFEVATSAVLLAIPLFVHAGLLLANVILRKPTGPETLVFLVIFSLHPFSTEFYHFSEGTLVFAFAVWVASFALYVSSIIQQQRWAVPVGVILLVVALAIYQTAIAQAIVVALLALVAWIALREPSDVATTARSMPVRVLLIIAASVPIYLLSSHVLRWFMGVGADARSQFSQLLADPLSKLVAMADTVQAALWPSSGLITRLDSALLIGLLLMSAAGVLWSVLRARRWAATAAILVLLIAGLMWSTGFSALSDTVWLVPRTMAVVGTFSAGLLMLGWRVRSWVAWRAILTIGVIVLTIGYVGASNRILHDQRLVNRWDMAEANRILVRLEQEPGYQDLRSLAILGGRWSYPASLPSTWGDMNISALAVQWAKLGLVEQATGYRFASPTETQLTTATEYCSTSERWPAPGSVVQQGELGIVCLPDP